MKMTVAELVARLQAFPADAAVVTPGFDESCYDDVATVEEVRIRRDVRKQGHCGCHDEGGPGDELAVLVNF